MQRWLAMLSSAVIACLLVAPAQGQDMAVAERALADAARTFARALPGLGESQWGVDTQAYRDALTQRRFHSALWGAEMAVRLVVAPSAEGPCARFAAYVRPQPAEGAIDVVLCPEFFTPGADALRETTMLHEMVHVVAGTDECQAMAYAAEVQMLADGAFLRVTSYWERNGCGGSGYALPR